MKTYTTTASETPSKVPVCYVNAPIYRQAALREEEDRRRWEKEIRPQVAERRERPVAMERAAISSDS